MTRDDWREFCVYVTTTIAIVCTGCAPSSQHQPDPPAALPAKIHLPSREEACRDTRVRELTYQMSESREIDDALWDALRQSEGINGCPTGIRRPEWHPPGAQADLSRPTKCLIMPTLPGCPAIRGIDILAHSMGSLETEALRCGYSAAPLGEAIEAWLRKIPDADRSDLTIERAAGRSMPIDPYRLDCNKIAGQLRRWQEELPRK
jgi:hypothetical protein